MDKPTPYLTWDCDHGPVPAMELDVPTSIRRNKLLAKILGSSTLRPFGLVEAVAMGRAGVEDVQEVASIMDERDAKSLQAEAHGLVQAALAMTDFFTIEDKTKKPELLEGAKWDNTPKPGKVAYLKDKLALVMAVREKDGQQKIDIKYYDAAGNIKFETLEIQPEFEFADISAIAA